MTIEDLSQHRNNAPSSSPKIPQDAQKIIGVLNEISNFTNRLNSTLKTEFGAEKLINRNPENQISR